MDFFLSAPKIQAYYVTNALPYWLGLHSYPAEVKSGPGAGRHWRENTPFRAAFTHLTVVLQASLRKTSAACQVPDQNLFFHLNKPSSAMKQCVSLQSFHCQSYHSPALKCCSSSKRLQNLHDFKYTTCLCSCFQQSFTWEAEKLHLPVKPEMFIRLARTQEGDNLPVCSYWTSIVLKSGQERKPEIFTLIWTFYIKFHFRIQFYFSLTHLQKLEVSSGASQPLWNSWQFRSRWAQWSS